MISVIIPTYKNYQQLIKNLTINLPFFKNLQVIIVNDDPKLNLRDKLKQLKHFNKITIIQNKKNLGFSSSINKGVAVAKNRFILLLNDDVELINDNFIEVTKLFQKDRLLFAVGFAQKEHSGNLVGKNVLRWQRGMLIHQPAKDINFGYTGWAEGGAAMIDRDKFIALKGFDSIFNPFYWEDIDLSYRAWQSGYKVIFSPEVIVIHHHGTTIRRQFPATYIRRIAYRNQFLFIWKNIRDLQLILNHWLWLPINLIINLQSDVQFLFGMISAGFLLPKILFQKKTSIKYSDREILKLFK